MLARRAKTIFKTIPILFPLFRTVSKPLRERIKFRRLERYCSLLPDTARHPTFVMIGANDGTTEDPISEILLADSRWRGVLIEPVPYCFRRLATTFHDSQRFALEQVAIGKAAGVASLYYVDESAVDKSGNRPFWFDQVGSFDRDHVLKHVGAALGQRIVECSVEVCLLSDILRKHNIDGIHFLQIDTEGYDYEIVKTLDLANHAPSAILVEHSHLPSTDKEEMLNLLRANGYKVDSCGAYDYFAIHNKAPLSSLVWDDALPS